jgi:HK97 family phage prohead protease
LRLRKDSRGLNIEVEPDEGITYARDIIRAVARGDVSGMSFTFRTVGENETWWKYDETLKMPVRTVQDMRIREVSIVTFPAYSATDVQVAKRSLDAFQRMNPLRDERWLRLKLAR